MLDAFDAEHVVKVAIRVGQRLDDIMLLKSDALVLQHKCFGVNVETVNIAVAELDQFLGKRTVPCRHIENTPLGCALK